MHLSVMSDNLVKLVSEIDNLVSGFVSKAQLAAEPAEAGQAGGAEPMQAPKDAKTATFMVKQAITATLQDKRARDAALNKWNAMLDKLSDADYQRALMAEKLDVQVTAQLVGGGYRVTMKADIVPPMPNTITQFLQPFFTQLAGKATIKANAVKRQNKNAGSVGNWVHDRYLVFR